MKHFIRPACFIAAAFSLVGHVSANGGGYVTGLKSTGAFKPLGIEQVEMLSEKLDIDLYIEHADVRIEYVLHNPGPKVTVEAGFPSATAWDRYPTPDAPAPTKDEMNRVAMLRDFQLKADGKEIRAAVRHDALKLLSIDDADTPLTEGATVNAWHVFKLDFAQGQTRRIEVRYRNPYHCSYSSVSDDVFASPLTLTYLFSSAAAWKGPIKQGVVTVRAVSANPEWVKFNHAQRFKLRDKVWQWSFADFEPTLEDDLVITTRPHTFGSYNFIPLPEGTDDDYPLMTAYMGWGAKRNFEEGGKMGGKWELWHYDYTAMASSTLAPQGELRYDASFLATDEDESSAWVEGVKGDGIGESVTLTLRKPANVRRIGLVNGYAKSDDLYAKNNRVARLEVSVNDGEAFSVNVPDECLHDEKYFFDLPAESGPVKTVRLTIAEVYKGTKYDDTCLSSVVLVVPLAKEPAIQGAR